MTGETSSTGAAGRGLGARLGLALGSLVVALGLAEGVARWTDRPAAPIALAQFADAVSEGHGTNFDRIFRWDEELLWRLAPDVRLPEDERPFFGLVSNAQGLREDHPVPPGAHPGELRILCLGDSVTFGYGVEAGRCFVAELERALAERFPGRRIECINAGVPGYTLVQGLRSLELEGLSLRPDLVLLNFGWNERATWSGGGDLERLARRAGARPTGLLARSRLWTRAFGTRTVETEEGEERPRVTPEEFGAELARARALCADHGVALALLVGPGRFNLKLDDKSRTFYQIEQYRIGQGMSLAPGVPALIDGVAPFRALASEHAAEDLFLDGVHPTELGHRVLAEALAGGLAPWVERQP